MKFKFLSPLIILLPIFLCGQTNLYVSNNGTNTGQSPPTVSNPFKTLENALSYIKNNHTDANNKATTPINIYLMENGGDILISSSGILEWNVSGTVNNPIKITSLNERATLTRSNDSKHMLYLEKVDYLSINLVDFDKVASGAILIDNGDHNEISFCSFHGEGEDVEAVKSGVVWIGINRNYTGQNSETSSNNIVKHNLFYDIKVSSTDSLASFHHAVYISQGAHNNTISFNYINYAPGIGIFGNHGDYKNNYFSTNLVTKKKRK